MKKCGHCKLVKSFEAFCRDRSQPSGLANWCKNCLYAYRKKVWLNLKTQKGYIERQRTGQRKYAKKHPEKVQAHQFARKHKTKLKSKVCKNCNSTKNLHMHHPNYSKPLEVVTLCSDCHETLHHGVLV